MPSPDRRKKQNKKRPRNRPTAHRKTTVTPATPLDRLPWARLPGSGADFLGTVVPVDVRGRKDGQDTPPRTPGTVGEELGLYVVPIDRPDDAPDLVRVLRHEHSAAPVAGPLVGVRSDALIEWLNAVVGASTQLFGIQAPPDCPACGQWSGDCDCSGDLRRAAYAAAARTVELAEARGEKWNAPPEYQGMIGWAVAAAHHHAGGQPLRGSDDAARSQFVERLLPTVAAGVPDDLEAAGLRPITYRTPDGRELTPPPKIPLAELPWRPLPAPCGDWTGVVSVAQSGTELLPAVFVRHRGRRPVVAHLGKDILLRGPDPAAGHLPLSPFRRLNPVAYVDWLAKYAGETLELLYRIDDRPAESM